MASLATLILRDWALADADVQSVQQVERFAFRLAGVLEGVNLSDAQLSAGEMRFGAVVDGANVTVMLTVSCVQRVVINVGRTGSFVANASSSYQWMFVRGGSRDHIAVARTILPTARGVDSFLAGVAGTYARTESLPRLERVLERLVRTTTR